MRTDGNRPKPRLLAAALLVAGAGVMVTPGALAQTAGTVQGLAHGGAGESLRTAKSLAEEGRLVEARELVTRLTAVEELSAMSAEDRAELVRVMGMVETQLKAADPTEVSLQRAEFALSNGDLRQAERHAKLVVSKAGSAEQGARAADVLARVSARQAELKPIVSEWIGQAVKDFEARRFAQAKAGLQAVSRSGVELSAQEQRVVEQYQLRIVEIERSSGVRLDDSAAMAMMQPGTVRRTGEPGAGQPNGQPANQPAGEPGMEDAPPAAQPGAQGTDDLIQAAMRADAERILAEADFDFESQRFNDAIRKYNITLNANRRFFDQATLARAEQRLAEARVRIQGGGPTGIGQDVVRNIEVIRQQSIAEFENFIGRAERALEAGDTAAATQLAANAQFVVSTRRNAFSEAEVSEFTARVNRLNQAIETERERLARATAEDRQRQIERDRQQTEEMIRRDRERQISENIDRIRALQQEQRYSEALEIVDRVLFLDPINPTGLLLRDALSDIVVFQRHWEIQRLKQDRAALQSLDNQAAMIPNRAIMEYPSDWPTKSFNRGEQAAYADSPEDRRVLAELDTRRLPIAFDNNRFEDVLNFLATVTQLDMDVDWASLENIGINRDVPISLRLTNVPARVALDRVLERVSRDQFARANWAVNDGVLIVASDEALRRQTRLITYNITDMLLEIPNHYDAPEVDLQTVLQSAQGGGQSPFRDDQQQRRTPEEQEQLRRDRIDRIIQIIQDNVDTDGWRERGGDTGAISELGGTLLIRNTPRNHREIVGLLSQLREIRSMQINVETKFLLVNQDWFEQIAFDIDLVLNANNNQVRAARAGDPTIQPRDFFSFGGTGARGLQRSVTGAVAPFGPVTDVDDTALTQGVQNPRAWAPVGFVQDSFGLGNNLAAGNAFANSILSSAPALGIAGQFLDDIQVDFLIQATQADRRSVSLTAPRLTFTNGQVSNIYVVTQQAFISDLQPVVADSAVGFDPDVAVVPEGVTLLVEGVISADRRYVTMNVDAGVSRIDGFDASPVTAVAGGQLVTSADTQSFIQLPTVTVTRVRTTVTVPDEGTVLLGGQRLVTELEIETGVPVLSKIPIINRFFTNRIETREESTLLILLKPTILIQSEEEAKNFPGLADQLRATGLGN